MSYDILIFKLNHFDIRDSAHELMQSFLNRKQFVSINYIKSANERVIYRISEGSTLCPILFFLYFNDLLCSRNCLSRLIADDTDFIINSTELTILVVMNNEIANGYNWLQATSSI